MIQIFGDVHLTNNKLVFEYCFFKKKKLDHTTNKPIIFAVSAVAFILFPFLVFIIYDRTMKKQQNEIISTANRSHAIVSSLFPSNVRDQLDTINYNTKSFEKAKRGTYNLTQILGPPIAELYPETTVLFCDVVNFTKWSSGKFH